MNITELNGITCGFKQCEIFRAGGDPVEVLDFMEQHEGEFIHEHTREKFSNLLEVIRDDPDALRFGSLSLRHPTFQPDVYDYAHAAEKGLDPQAIPGAVSFSYIDQTRTMSLRQVISFPDNDPVKVERVGIGLLQFIYHFAPLLRPAYGYIDIIPEDAHPGAAFNRTGTVGFLCWANYFGPKLVAEAGEAYLLEAPGWQRVKLPCGGILYVVTENFLDWHFGKHRPYVQYFRKAFPNIEEL